MCIIVSRDQQAVLILNLNIIGYKRTHNGIEADDLPVTRAVVLAREVVAPSIQHLKALEWHAVCSVMVKVSGGHTST